MHDLSVDNQGVGGNFHRDTGGLLASSGSKKETIGNHTPPEEENSN